MTKGVHAIVRLCEKKADMLDFVANEHLWGCTFVVSFANLWFIRSLIMSAYELYML